MTTTETIPSVDLDAIVGDPALDPADPIKAHIVRRQPGDPRTAAAVVMEARVNGTPLVALCGWVWVPTRNPDDHPLCEKCLDIRTRIGDVQHPRN